MNDQTVITAENIVKRYGVVDAVKGISFQVEAGQCIGLLGPNGAGKTSTMRMIMGLSTVTAGRLTVFGRPVEETSREMKARIGLVPQEDNLDPDITVEENLEVYGRYFGIEPRTVAARVPPLLEFMELQRRRKARVVELSGGMKRRLVIARAMIANPELIVLDEPTTGLDPQARVLIWTQLQALKKQGKTLLLTTHYMDEAERLCDRIIVIDHGEILEEGTPQELIDRHVRGHVIEVQKPLPKELTMGEMAVENIDQEDIGASVLFYVSSPADLVAHLPDAAIYRHRQANLEDVFLRLTGRKLRES